MVLQHKLGARNAGTFDVNCACAAFPALVAIGSGLVATNAAMTTVLLVGVDMIHKLTDLNDAGCFLWGDGAGAVVMEAGDQAGFIGAAFHADGTYAPEPMHLTGASSPVASAVNVLSPHGRARRCVWCGRRFRFQICATVLLRRRGELGGSDESQPVEKIAVHIAATRRRRPRFHAPPLHRCRVGQRYRGEFRLR